MKTTEQGQFEVRPTRGRGKMVTGFLIYNVGLTLLLDSNLFYFSMVVFALGFLLFLYGHLENFWVARAKNPAVVGGSAKHAMGVMVAFLLLAANGVAATEPLKPTAQIREIDQVLKTFHNGKNLSAAETKENQAIKDRILKEDFDLTEMCRLALDHHWKTIPAAKRTEFVGLFTNLLLRNAILHSEKHTGHEKIDYLAEEAVKGKEFAGRKRVKTKIEVPDEAVDFDVNYDMVFDAKKNRWRIYDLILDEESLMANYREQFDRIIAKEGFNGLMGRLKKKLGNQTL